MTDIPVKVVGTGANSSIGMTAHATAAAVRAGIAGFTDHPFMVDRAGKPMVVAIAPFFGVDFAGSDRLSAMASSAAVEASGPLASISGSSPSVEMYVGYPPMRPGRPADLTRAKSILRESITSSGMKIGSIEFVECGHAAGAIAVQAAWQAIRSGAVDFALAGGVDSYMEPETLEWLEENEQLHSAGKENNAYGFIPGEAAGFVLLASGNTAKRHQLVCDLEVDTVATTQEKKLIKTDSVCLGEGLTELFRNLAGDDARRRADFLYCDMNGEPYRADEFGFATIRGGTLFKDPSQFAAPADCWGDVGAASAPLFLVLANAAMQKGYATGNVIAAYTSSESGERSGFVVRRCTDSERNQWD